MRAIKGIVTARWFLTLVGAIALALLIWFIGPLIAIASVRPLAPDVVRLLVVMAILVAWGVVTAIRLARERKQANELESAVTGAGTAAGAGGSAAREELRVLEKQLNEAVTTLRQARGGGRRKGRYLYDLPWYILIGPPGSGKTTALSNSGLRFPLSDGQAAAARGVGGTRHCDWWFADTAILLDTAGRYTTQDSQPDADSEAWTGFLDLLRRTRPRQPINGALVAISLGDVLSMDEPEIVRHARAVHARLSELQSKLGVRFPVYVLFTKADLVAGFAEFFDDLGREARAQVWGATFPFDDGSAEGGAVARFAHEFDALADRLNDRALMRIHDEHDRERRGILFGFPTQFAALKPKLARFLNEVFVPSRLGQPFLLRGFYFTSGTQEGRPVDRVMAAMSKALGLAQERRASGRHGRAYFIHDVLKRVAFDEAGLVSASPGAERRDRLLRYGAVGAAAAVLVAASLAWLVSYQGNRALIDQVAAQVAEFEEQSADLTPVALNEPGLSKVLPALNTLGDLPTGYTATGDADLSLTFGLYQGDKLGSQAIAAYRRGLEQLFLPPLLARLEQQIAQSMDSHEVLFEALKVYLMLGGKGPLEPATVQDWMTLQWERRFPGERGVRDDLTSHLHALMTEATLDYPLDGGLIERARERLQAQPLAERAYTMIRQSAGARALDDWSLTDRLGRPAAALFRRHSATPLDEPIPGIYTKSGFYTVFLPAVADVIRHVNEESWVLDQTDIDAGDRERLRRQLLNAYYRDYERAWRRLLDDLRFREARTLDALVGLFTDVATPNSPAVRLLEMATRQTSLTEPPKTSAAGAAGTAARVAEEASTGGRNRLARIVGDELMDMAQRPGAPVEAAFAELHRFVKGAGLTGYIEDLRATLRRLETASARGEPLDPNLLRVTAALPRPVNAWMQGLADGVRTVARSSARQSFASAWNGTVAQACQDVVAGRYPFAPESNRPAPLDDFARLFGPGGLLASFYRDHMADRVDTSGRSWRWKPGVSAAVGPPAMPEQFRRARAIRQAFFGIGSERPGVAFALEPTRLDANAEQVRLIIDGTEVTYAHGPVRPIQVRWPGADGAGTARLTFRPTPTDTPGGVTLNGPWAWFRLLDQARVEFGPSPDVIDVTFSLGELSATFTLRADSVQNPFTLDALRTFSCPPRL